MKRFAVALVALVSACAAMPAPGPAAPPPAGETLNPMDLSIAIGRWDAMLSQAQDLTAEAVAELARDESDADPRADLARRLRDTVWSYNVLSSRLCAVGAYTELSCQPAFSPAWLSEPPGATPSYAEIARRSEAVGAKVGPLWGAACDHAAAASGEERMILCPME